MSTSERGGDADQSDTTPVTSDLAAEQSPKQKLSITIDRSKRTSAETTTILPQRLSLGMDRLDRTSTETTGLEAEISVHSGDNEIQQDRSYGLDPAAIFQKVTEDEIKKLAPEQNITLFALRLALIEKSASGIGTLSFIWASTILLGGFASNLNPVDFIVISIILVTEGTRIFSRSRELEWQHLASKSTKRSLPSQPERSLKVSQNYGSVTPEGEPTPSSGLPGIKLERGPKASYKSATYAASPEDLESGLSNATKKLQRTPQLSTTDMALIGKPPGDKKKKRNEGIPDVESGHGMNSPLRRWLSENREDASDKGKTAETVLRTAVAKNIKRTWNCLVPVLPGQCGSIVSTRGVSAVLYWVQMTSAVICFALPCWRLSKQEYTPPTVLRRDTPVNLYTSLNIFYTLSLTEALLFLIERAYWEFKMNYEQLVVQVSDKAGLGEENQDMMKQFFYEVYKKCIDGTVFDGLGMDFVEYSMTLLQSDNSLEQLSGLRVLRKIVDRYDGFALDALRRIGAAPGLIERMVEMLSWRGTHQSEIRLEVAALICRLVRYSKNCFRVAAVPGAMERIVSLLKPHERDHVIPSLYVSMDLLSSERATALRLDGLRILVAIARDLENLLKIGETRGLASVLVTFIAVKDVDAFRKMEGSELKTFKKVLRLLRMLSAAPNTSATIRPVVVKVLFSISSMRDILEFGDCHPQLQWMVIDILNSIAVDHITRRAIGSMGGIIRNLFALYNRNPDWSHTLFVSDKDRKAEKAVSKRAGDALNLLAMCRKNCLRMIDLQDGNGKKIFVPGLMGILNEYREQTICAAKILRSLLEYGDYSQKQEIAVCIVRVMRLVMGSSSQRMHEAVVGLASRVLPILDEPAYNQAFENVDRTELVQKLLKNLDYNPHGPKRLPRIRRHSIEFILALVHRDPSFFAEFMTDGLLEKKLVQTLDTIFEAEDFIIFSGAEGLTRHSISMEDLVQQSIREVQILDREREEISSETLEVGAVQYPKITLAEYTSSSISA